MGDALSDLPPTPHARPDVEPAATGSSQHPPVSAAVVVGAAFIAGGAAAIGDGSALVGAAFIVLGAAAMALVAAVVGPSTMAIRAHQLVDWATKAPRTVDKQRAESPTEKK